MFETRATQDGRTTRIETPLGRDVLLLKSFSIHEQLSQPFRIDVELMSESATIDYDKIVGQPVSILMDTSRQVRRHFQGLVFSFAQTASEGRFRTFQAVILPRWSLLSLSSACRIFQDLDAVEVVTKILAERRIDFLSKVPQGALPKIPYCVQYRETELNFCQRLLEEYGIYYHFVHTKEKDIIVFVDSPSQHDPFEAHESIEFRPYGNDSTTAGDFIREWSVRRGLQTSRYEHTDFDFTRPKVSLLQKGFETRQSHGQEFRIFDYPGGFMDATVGARLAKVRLDELESAYELRSGAGDSRGIAAGHRFKLAGETFVLEFPRPELDFVEYLVVSARLHQVMPSYEAQGGEGSFQCSFAVIPASAQFRPRRQTPKPFVQGPQTATVVGPPNSTGEEIYTDQHGRVKVLFHWDRAEEKKACWIRVAQMIAGRRWGSIAIPRVGQEVIVEFLEGDPDCPIITGCVYNGDNRSPFPLAEQKNIIGLKSSSTKGGRGYNELSIDDSAGQELIRVHGQRDLQIVIERDRTTRVVHNDTLEVTDGDESTTIAKGKSVTVAMQSIELRVGKSRIRLEPGGISIEGMNIKINGEVKAAMQAPMANVEGGAVVTVKGGLVRIN